jgi:drug/metabolite transporter (DMT)-like permease
MNGQAPRLTPSSIALIVASAACFTVIDTIVKYLGSRYSTPLLVLARWGLPAVLIIMLLGPKMRWKLFGTAKPSLHVARAGALILSSLSFFTALKFLPLAEATSLNYCTPAIVTILAAWLLREKHSRTRWMFVIAGAVGILLIVQPGQSTLHASALLALAAAALNATFQILTRKLAGEDFIVLLFYPSVVGALLISLTIPFAQYDASLMTSDLLLLAAIAGIGGIGHCLFVQAFRRAPASAIAPFMYVQVILSTFAGWLAFGTFPGAYALAGISVIVVGAIAAAWIDCRTADQSGADALGAATQISSVLITPEFAPSRMKFNLSRQDTAMGAFQVDIGESMAFVDAGGACRTVLRTD